MNVDLHDLGLDRGGHLLVRRALRTCTPGDELEVRGRDPALGVHLRGWCRAQGHGFAEAAQAGAFRIRRGGAEVGRWRGALDTGHVDPTRPGAVAQRASPRWGLAARGTKVEASAPPLEFSLVDKDEVWADEAATLYAQAVAAQWDPARAIPWDAPADHPAEVEDAIVQVMSYLVENETAALVVPARFLGQVHPHFREVMQLLAVQTADEARHIEVFTRRGALRRESLGLSTAGGQASLATLLDEPDFAQATFLLSVLGEGSFLSLLWFLHRNAPDETTRVLVKLAAQDEARHVAFGLAHLSRRARRDPSLRARLALATERRHAELSHTAGLNEEVFDALVLLAAGSWDHAAIARGWDAVQGLVHEMDEGRRRRLERLGFSTGEAEALSALHTRNFM